MNMPGSSFLPMAAYGTQPMAASADPFMAMAPSMASAQQPSDGWTSLFAPQQAQPGFAAPTTGMAPAAAGGQGGFFSQPGAVGGILNGIAALGGAYLGYKQLGLAKDQFGFQKEAFRTNLANSIQSYNTSLEDRIRGRTSAHDGKEAEVQSYLARHSLKKSGG